LSDLEPADWQDLFSIAEAGDPEAQYWLGSIFQQGRLLPADRAKSNYWYHRAASQGYARAEYLLCLKNANPDSLENEGCLRRAAEDGVPEAQLWLGVAFRDHWFGVTDDQEALKWCRKAAEGGDADAEADLGWRYDVGDGVEQDSAKALYWFRRAAVHVPNLGGAGQGRNGLGNHYLGGDGVPKDYVQAYMWFSLAGTEQNLAYVQARMTPEQISQAQQLAADWKRQHPDPAIY